ncbi:NIF family HAD-type phosphatase [Priestia filamentosa]|uniref:NIF family HAD-type phosphatase n=1 Tax=Priestia filamentosa TaxID=1402861 RepID=UPI00058969CE
MSKKILFDLENTLVGSYRNHEGKLVLEARPGVLNLIEKLRDLRKQKDVEYILFSNLSKSWTELKLEVLQAENFFEDVVYRETILPVEAGSIEDKVFGAGSEFYGLKPFSVIEGDLLLVEDNPFAVKAGELIRSEYKAQQPSRKIEVCKVSFYEAVDPRRYEIIEELENQEEKTEFNEKRLLHMKENLDKIGVDNEKEMERVYDSIVEFTFGIGHTNVHEHQGQENHMELNDFELQVQKLIDIYF